MPGLETATCRAPGRRGRAARRLRARGAAGRDRPAQPGRVRRRPRARRGQRAAVRRRRARDDRHALPAEPRPRRPSRRRASARGAASARWSRAIARLAGWSAPAVDLEERVDALTAGGIDALRARAGAEPCASCRERPVRPALLARRPALAQRGRASCAGSGLERAVGLDGGYKALSRAACARASTRWSAPPTFVLRGLTGRGQDARAARARSACAPGWTLDLEALAGHRSSILGMVGLEPCSQKTFESRLRRAPRARLSAGRGRRRGREPQGRRRRSCRARVWRALEGGVDLELVASRRAARRGAVADYLATRRAPRRAARPAAVHRGAPRPREVRGRADVRLLDARREAELVVLLLERYYDPLYRHSENGRAHAVRIRCAGSLPPRRRKWRAGSGCADPPSPSKPPMPCCLVVIALAAPGIALFLVWLDDRLPEPGVRDALGSDPSASSSCPPTTLAYPGHQHARRGPRLPPGRGRPGRAARASAPWAAARSTSAAARRPDGGRCPDDAT